MRFATSLMSSGVTLLYDSVLWNMVGATFEEYGIWPANEAEFIHNPCMYYPLACSLRSDRVVTYYPWLALNELDCIKVHA